MNGSAWNMVSGLSLFQGLPGQNQGHQLFDQLINHLNQLMTTTDLLETMQKIFLAGIKKILSLFTFMNGWMDVYAKVWAQ